MRSLLLLLVFSSFLSGDSGQDQYAVVMQRARAAAQRANWMEAVEAYKHAAKLAAPDCRSCWKEIAIGLTRGGDEKQALKAADQLISISQSKQEQAEGHSLRAEILRAFAQNNPKKLGPSIAEMRVAEQLNPADADTHFALGVALLKTSSDEEGITELRTYLEMKPDGFAARHARILLAHPRKAMYDLAPRFQMATLSGQDLSSDELSGKVLLLDFWATWCPSCVDALPELRGVAKKYGDKVTVISISVDEDRAAWSKYVSAHGMTWNQVLDNDSHLGRAFKIQVIPTYIIIDREGFIHEEIVGGGELADHLKAALRALPEPEGVATN